MELHQLRYFCAIVDSGSFSRAAAQTHVSQPSLSQQIAKLEEELGVRLFDRLGRSVRLTSSGHTFMPRARAILRELETARGEVREGSASLTGTVTVGVIPTVAPYLLPPLLASFAKKYPHARVSVVEDITPLLLERVKAGVVDVALLALPVRGPQFESTAILSERMYAALPARHPLAKEQALSLEALEREPFLLLRDGHCFRDAAMAACQRARMDPQIVFESGQFSSILSMVAAGQGVSMVPEMAIERGKGGKGSRTGCQFVPIADEEAARTIGVVKLKARSLTRLQELFVQHLLA